MKTAAIAFLILWTPVAVFGLTPKEREKVKQALAAVEKAIGHGEELQRSAEQARIEANNANEVARMAAGSALEAGLKAKSALDEASRCQEENAKMRPIVDAVTGPWWFPGGNALIYGAKKSLISLLVIIAGVIVIFLIIGFAVPGARPALNAVSSIFGKLWRWLVAIVTRKSKSVADNIEHRTIGSDPPDRDN